MDDDDEDEACSGGYKVSFFIPQRNKIGALFVTVEPQSIAGTCRGPQSLPTSTWSHLKSAYVKILPKL